MNDKRYKEPIKSEEETYMHFLHFEGKFLVYTNNVSIQKQLNNLIGEPTKEYKIKRSIAGSEWEIPFTDISKIQKVFLRAKLFE